ncbi:hypothetical protein FLONG3_4328 [Fusarium longipes]|uniref:DUF6546 domain-containing protein n=1 Tax=Fusarium longipes TaxID=694270 RepID=A0A395SYJ0_9HYPO|nr:hypothetical protein FLONG3_4328 [Fusarium longipes]
MPRFYSLPAEIQSMILNFVAEPSPTSSTQNTSCLFPYACVDRLWNKVFEAIIFKSLTITQNDILPLSHIMRGHRRSLLKHLWLRIRLPEYPTPEFKKEEDPRVLWELDSVFTKSIFSLWDVLSGWDSTGRKGMTLELSADSPSDWAGVLLDNCSTDKDVELYKTYLASGSTEQYDAAEDIHTPYVNLHKALGTTSGYLTNKRRDEYCETAHEETVQELGPQLAPVSVVTKFLIRRQQFREIYPTALNKILGSLSAVQDIHVERWRCAESHDEKAWCKEAQITFGMDLPPSAKRLCLYGETSKIFHTWEAKEAAVVSLAKSMRQYTKDLEHLSISHLIDAKEFLRPSWLANSDKGASSPDWKNLKTLSLTSDIFNSGTKKEINNLLCAAARAAKRMPNLQKFEIWNDDEERACVFCYRAEDTVGEIIWRGTRVKTLDNEVVRVWAVTSIINNRPDVRELFEPIDEDVVARNVLKYLSSKDQALHPVSACRQIDRNTTDDDDRQVDKEKQNATK